jgi:hypothetical protein
MLFSIAVPLVPSHDSFFFEFLLDVSKNPERVGEVIASRSSGTFLNISRFDRKLSKVLGDGQLTFPVKVLHSRGKLLAGENRNKAWAAAKFEYVAFCDADDSYSPFRLTMLEDAIRIYEPSLLVHDYFSGERQSSYSYESPENLEYVGTQELYEATFLGSKRDRKSEGLTAGDTNIRVPHRLNNHTKIHHAHSCVRNELRSKFQFGTTFRAEDGQFCRDVLEAKESVIYVPWELSTWVYSRSTAPTPRLQTFRKILNRIRKSLTSRY